MTIEPPELGYGFGLASYYVNGRLEIICTCDRCGRYWTKMSSRPLFRPKPIARSPRQDISVGDVCGLCVGSYIKDAGSVREVLGTGLMYNYMLDLQNGHH